MKKIAMFLPAPTPFYIYLFRCIKRGFESHGVKVMGTTSLLPENELIRFCKQVKPDAVFEMNRSRNKVPDLSPEICHISWIVDTYGRNNNEFSGSEITYFFGKNWHKFIDWNNSTFVDWLPPGVCPKTFSYGKLQKKSDFSLLVIFHIHGATPKNSEFSVQIRIEYFLLVNFATFSTQKLETKILAICRLMVIFNWL